METKTWLLAVAAPKEALAVFVGAGLSPSDADGAICWSARQISRDLSILVTGVGKANAAAAVARAIDPSRHAGVISLGIAGSLPGSDLAIGDVLAAQRCVYADEGMQSPSGFTSIAEMGFGPLTGICGDGSGLDEMSISCCPPPWKHPSPAFIIHKGSVATVSTCSGTTALAMEVRRRTGAHVEDMEAAAIGFTLARLSPSLPFSAIKVVSNTTGDRAEQSWDIAAALAQVSKVVRSLVG